MLIGALFLMLCGVVMILRSGSLSGKAIIPETFLDDDGLAQIVRHIFTHNPFSGFQHDRRILYFGVSGLFLLIGGTLLGIYATWLIAHGAGR